MVSNLTIVSMFIPIVFSFLLFIGLILFFRRKTGIAKKPLLLGAAGFFVFSQVLEKILHVIVLSCFPHLLHHPIYFGVYGGIAAGIFEEFGRFMVFTWLLKSYHEYQSGISFGIGWGGLEAVLTTLMGIVPNLIFAFLINAGTFESTFGGKLSLDQLQILKNGVIQHGVGYYLLACSERFFAVFLQIFFSLLVLYAVVKKKLRFLFLAILIHTFVDFIASFVQTGLVKQLWTVEVFIAIVGLICMMLIQKSRNWFD